MLPDTPGYISHGVSRQDVSVVREGAEALHANIGAMMKVCESKS